MVCGAGSKDPLSTTHRVVFPFVKSFLIFRKNTILYGFPMHGEELKFECAMKC